MTEKLLSKNETKRKYGLNEPLYTQVLPIYKSAVLGVSVTWACCVSMTISPDFSSASCSPVLIARKGVAVKINR